VGLDRVLGEESEDIKKGRFSIARAIWWGDSRKARFQSDQDMYRASFFPEKGAMTRDLKYLHFVLKMRTSNSQSYISGPLISCYLGNWSGLESN